MAPTSAPSTPQLRNSQAAVSTPSPGSWRHPKFDEITRRQKADTFNDSNLKRIAWNGGALLILVYLHEWFQSILGHDPLQPLGTITYWAFWFLGLYNIFIALLPLLKNKDELTDIPLTPTQRSLLGLDPRATPPPTPDTKYVTPPRYPRSPTPRNISPARNSSAYSTPISRSPSFGRESSDSPKGSPWGQKSLGRTRDTARRSSYGSPSPLGPGFGGREGSILGAPSTPSPTIGRGASVGLNSKWLYHRGRSSSGVYSASTLVG